MDEFRVRSSRKPSDRSTRFLKRLLTTIAFVALAAVEVMAGATEQEIANEVDRLLAEHFRRAGISPTPLVNDEDFLRRIMLDLTGTIPAPRELTLFGLNTSARKRSDTIDALLNSERFAETWASYWRDVIFLRATEQRALRQSSAFQNWMQEQLRQNRPWSDITRDLITATGPIEDAGQTGLIYAHTGQPEELAAEVSRIFLGIQISCANCHNHPTDAWTREDFHQLAAFFPRVTVRPEMPGDVRSFAVRSLDSTPGRGVEPPDPDRIFSLLDANRDGVLTREEAERSRFGSAERFNQLLSIADADKDGRISKEEFLSVQMLANQQPGRGSREHYMPDLENPAARGTLMQPVFFLPSEELPRLRGGSDDRTRRDALATMITSPQNPWFSRAFVNRIWAEMLGQGFYMPIDDLGPERTATFEDVLQVLADGFTANGYDLKWLYRTIASTEAYQRQLARGEAPPVPFSSATPTRLRSDQIYNSLVTVLGFNEGALAGRGYGGGQMFRGPRDSLNRTVFAELFGFDPSTPREDLLGNVPQALFLMNSTRLEQSLLSNGDTRLGRLLRKYSDDQDALHELYLTVLSREPAAAELEINQQYILNVGQRGEAYEDILWSLLNSAEFLSKR